MDRRGFLRGAAIAAGGLGGGVGLSRLLPDLTAQVPQKVVAGAAYANEEWRDPGLRETRVIWRVDTPDRLVALTFDDGPKPRNTAAVLAVLAEKKCPATFNVVGRNALEYPDLIKREIAGRHEIANHSWSHRDLAFAARDDASYEIRRGHEVVHQLTGRESRFFRPPKGDVSGVALNAASRLGVDVLLWSLKLHESMFDAPGNVDYLAENVRPGDILLAHDVGNASRLVGLRALPGLIDRLRGLGYTFVTASDLVASGRAVDTRAPTARPDEPVR